MEFPSDVLIIIKEYSMPITRSDWRTCGKIRKIVLQYDFHEQTSKYEYALICCRMGRILYNQSKNKIFEFEKYYSLFKKQRI